MRAVVVSALGGPEVLEPVELPDPAPGPGGVLVRVRAACVHPADLAARVGQIPGGPVPPPFLAGWDIAWSPQPLTKLQRYLSSVHPRS